MVELQPAVHDTFSALADATRRGVVELLCAGPQRAGALADHFGMSAPAMSKHLRVLRRCGLVEEARSDPSDARIRSYRLRREQFDELHAWLSEVRNVWTQQLDAFARQAATEAKLRKRPATKATKKGKK